MGRSSACGDCLSVVARSSPGAGTVRNLNFFRGTRQPRTDAHVVVRREATLLFRGRRRTFGDLRAQCHRGESEHRAALAVGRCRIGAAGVAKAGAQRLGHAADTLFEGTLGDGRGAALRELARLRVVDDAEAAARRRVAGDGRTGRASARAARRASTAVTAHRGAAATDGRRTGWVALCVATVNGQRSNQDDVCNDPATNSWRAPLSHRREYRVSRTTGNPLSQRDGGRKKTRKIAHRHRYVLPRRRHLPVGEDTST